MANTFIAGYFGALSIVTTVDTGSPEDPGIRFEGRWNVRTDGGQTGRNRSAYGLAHVCYRGRVVSFTRMTFQPAHHREYNPQHVPHQQETPHQEKTPLVSVLAPDPVAVGVPLRTPVQLAGC